MTEVGTANIRERLNETQALEYNALAQRSTLSGLAMFKGSEPQPIDAVAVIGAGTMGAGIAMCFASAGIAVALIDATQEGLDRGIASIKKNYQRSVNRGRITSEQSQAALNLISLGLEYNSVAGADLVIEAVFEDMPLKQKVFKKLDSIAKPEAILATNTSTFDIQEIARVTQRQSRVIGLHFFSPANVMPLLEVVSTESNQPDVVASAMHVAKLIGKTPVLAKICYGFIGNRMMEGYAREAELMVLEGASPAKVDAALREFGMAMGMLTVFDMAGIDVGVNVRKANADKLPPDPTYYQASQALYEAGRLGQKTGKGYYRYEPGDRAPHEDAEAIAIIRERAEILGITQRNDHSNKEIIERCIFALINEGFKILEEGVAQKASDIDVVWTLGYGFPRSKGGPMYYADAIGLDTVYQGVLGFQRQFGTLHWKASKLLENKARKLLR